MDKPARLRRVQDLCDPPPASIRHGPRETLVPPSEERNPPSVHASASFHGQRLTTSGRRNTFRPSTGPSLRLPSIHEVLASVSLGPSGSPSTSSTPSSSLASPSGRRMSTSGVGHPCDRCGRIFTRRADAAKHVRVVHDRVKNFACDICGRRFGRKDYLIVSTTSGHYATLPSLLLRALYLYSFCVLFRLFFTLIEKKHKKALHGIQEATKGDDRSTWTTYCNVDFIKRKKTLWKCFARFVSCLTPQIVFQFWLIFLFWFQQGYIDIRSYSNNYLVTQKQGQNGFIGHYSTTQKPDTTKNAGNCKSPKIKTD